MSSNNKGSGVDDNEERLLKAEYEGFLFFNRLNEEGWVDINSFYASDDYGKGNKLEDDELDE